MDAPMMADTVTLVGAGGDDIEAYFARPLGTGPYPGVVVIHHMPGFDRSIKEIVRSFAVSGYATVCPNLFHRYAAGATAGDAAAAAFAAGGVPDPRCVADVDAGVRYLRALPYSNGRVGVVGFAPEDGRRIWSRAASISTPPSTATGAASSPPTTSSRRSGRSRRSISRRSFTARCSSCSAPKTRIRRLHVARIERELRVHGKTFEFHTFENAGHAFFSSERPSYRVEAAKEGWKRHWAFFGQNLANGVASRS